MFTYYNKHLVTYVLSSLTAKHTYSNIHGNQLYNYYQKLYNYYWRPLCCIIKISSWSI